MKSFAPFCSRFCRFVSLAITASNASIQGMATLTIRQLDQQTKTRLRVRAAHHGRSMEEEAGDPSFRVDRAGPGENGHAAELYTTAITEAEIFHKDKGQRYPRRGRSRASTIRDHWFPARSRPVVIAVSKVEVCFSRDDALGRRRKTYWKPWKFVPLRKRKAV